MAKVVLLGAICIYFLINLSLKDFKGFNLMYQLMVICNIKNINQEYMWTGQTNRNMDISEKIFA